MIYSALCPTTSGTSPPLHHPITLPCGHTLSADHITIPTPAPLDLHDLPPHEIFAAQQRQHRQRLSLWAGVMCPIPTCKRYSPNASTTPVVTDVLDLSGPPSPTFAVNSGAQLGVRLASGVTYYPTLAPTPPPGLPALPVYSANPPVVDTNTPLLDITVDKILNLVMNESSRRDSAMTSIRDRSDDSSDEGGMSDEDDEDYGGIDPSRGVSSGFIRDVLTDPGSPLALQASKRQRNALRSPITRPRSGSPDEWPFKKQLLGTVECDVCTMLLYEPVTAPCQHVSDPAMTQCGTM